MIRIDCDTCFAHSTSSFFSWDACSCSITDYPTAMRYVGVLRQGFGDNFGGGDDSGRHEAYAGRKAEVVRVRGLCRMRGAVLALVEW